MTTLVFALLAVFVIWKLRSVLGTGRDKNRAPYENLSKSSFSSLPNPSFSWDSPQNPLPAAETKRSDSPSLDKQWEKFAAPGTPLAQGLQQIALQDSSFNLDDFLRGAQAAYEIIVSAYSKDDRAALQPLLSKEIFENFVEALETRKARGETKTSLLISFDKVEPIEALVEEGVASITVRFSIKMISYTRDSSDQIIEGYSDKVIDYTDHWTFTRALDSHSPTWVLVAIENESPA